MAERGRGWARAVRGLLLDVSGVLYDSGADGGVPIAGSVEAVRRWVGGSRGDPRREGGTGAAPRGSAVTAWCESAPAALCKCRAGIESFWGHLGDFGGYFREGSPQSLG